jgi:hypothetical protein
MCTECKNSHFECRDQDNLGGFRKIVFYVVNWMKLTQERMLWWDLMLLVLNILIILPSSYLVSEFKNFCLSCLYDSLSCKTEVNGPLPSLPDHPVFVSL